MEILGWIGSILLSFCGVPEAWKSIRTKTCHLTWLFLLMWIGGEICILIPVLFQFPKAWLLLNYCVNIVCASILIWYKLYGKKEKTTIGFSH